MMRRKKTKFSGTHSEKYKPTDTVRLEPVSGSVVVSFVDGPDIAEKEISDANMADPSDVQELRVRLIREGFYGDHEERQLGRITLWVSADRIPIDVFNEEVRARFGPWPKAARDDKGRVIWHRNEFADMSDDLASLIRKSEKTVIR